ncbi:MAG: amidohydrolase [Solirubrobacteraceae bacterium]|nr:amidohydrolase [Solirubrobacteraceae bacterium]
MNASQLRLDLHGHAIPTRYRDELRALLGGHDPLPAWSLEDQLAMMDRHDISASVISLPPPGVFFGDATVSSRLAREVNEDIAEIVRAHPTRFGGLASLPLPDVDAALNEIAYALDELELEGVALLSNVGGMYVGDPAFAPVLDELHRRGAYVFLHPQVPPYAAPLAQYPVWLAEFPFETTRAVIDLIYGGTLERCPNLRLQLAHLGGTAPFIAGRIASLADREPDLASPGSAGAEAYLRRLFYDTGLSNHASGLAATREVAAIERIVFGTDWPFASLPAGDPAPALADLGGAVRRGVDAEHARALVPRLLDRAVAGARA